MQRISTLLTLLSVLISPLTHAQLSPADQTAVNQTAFKLTKATVEFLATDKLTFGNLAKTTCESCTDYKSLVQFIKVNKLSKADELVNDAQKKTAGLIAGSTTTAQALGGLRQYLNDRVTKGDSRERRTTLPSYKAYTAEINQLLVNAGVESDVPAPEADALTDVVPLDTNYTEDPIATATPAMKAEAGIFSYGGLALLISLLNLAGLFYLWSQRSKRKSYSSSSSGQITEISDRVTALETRQKALSNKVAQFERPAAVAQERPATPPHPQRAESVAPAVPVAQQPRQTQVVPPVTPQQAPRPAQPAPIPQPINLPQSATQNQSAPVPGNQPRRREVVLYGRTADLGDGFSVGSLLETPDRDTVFQIEIRSESQAVYRVTEEPGAQQLALSDPYSYLADACEYLAKPIPNARIRTNQPGQLALQGDKWKIVDKAKISFY